MKKYKLEQFSLEKLALGDTVCTRNGKEAKVLCLDIEYQNYPILALIQEKNRHGEFRRYTINGKCNMEFNSDEDLMIKVEIQDSNNR